MTCRLVPGVHHWGPCKRDKEGHRDYQAFFMVTSDATDGPANVMQCEGLPEHGDEWRFEGTDEVDVWAFCTQETNITPWQWKEGETVRHWMVEKNFTTRGDDKRCKDQQIDDPLQKPPDISGSFNKDKEEATRDRFGRPIVSTSHEQIRGPQVEFDKSRGSVKISMNVAVLNLALLEQMKDTLNDAELWGLPARCWKLTVNPWERKFYGKCYIYFIWSLEFESNVLLDPDTGAVSSGWDRDLLDEGTKVLHGHWDAGNKNGLWVLDPIGFKPDGTPIPPSPANPTHFDRFKDRQGENARVVLRNGVPAEASISGAAQFIALGPGNSGSPSTSPYPPGQWLALVGSIDAIDEWELGAAGPFPLPVNEQTKYSLGQLVTYGAGTFICIDPNNLTGDPPPSPGWLIINPPVDLGDYDADTNYEVGEVVHNTAKGKAGTIHVEKYNESNFLLLGIPLSLET